METLRFDVFGRDILIVESDNGWDTFYEGNDGKRRPADEIVIPSIIVKSEIAQYLEDLCHEWASDRNKTVKQLK